MSTSVLYGRDFFNAKKNKICNSQNDHRPNDNSLNYLMHLQAIPSLRIRICYEAYKENILFPFNCVIRGLNSTSAVTELFDLSKQAKSLTTQNGEMSIVTYPLCFKLLI